MRKTLVFSDELNYFPALHLNLRGREPHGQLGRSERGRVVDTLEGALYALRDPWSGKPVVRRLIAREELFEGPWVKRAPDYIVELNLDRTGAGEYSYNLMPSLGPGPKMRRLGQRELLGKKGRSLPGAHRSHGFGAHPAQRILRLANRCSTFSMRAQRSSPRWEQTFAPMAPLCSLVYASRLLHRRLHKVNRLMERKQRPTRTNG